MNNLLYVSRTKEALKSYMYLNNLNPNNYVIVNISDNLRNNQTLKSLAYNIEDNSFKFALVSKSLITKSATGKPILKVNKLKQKAKGKDKGDEKVSEVMGEFKEGKLHSGKSDKVVEDPKQAIAIALNEAGKSKPKKKSMLSKGSTKSLFNLVVKSLDEVLEDKEETLNVRQIRLMNEIQRLMTQLMEMESSEMENEDIEHEYFESSGGSKDEFEGLGNVIVIREEETKSLKDACWEGYEAIGMKKKNGKDVPNCVPKKKKK